MPGVSNAPRLGFTGQRLEDDIELYDYGARWYDPALGRFLQPDAFAPVYLPQGHNPYAYVRNDPVNLIDPTGNDGFVIGFGFGSQNKGPSAGGIGLGFGHCGLLGGVNPFVSSCPPGLSIGSIFRDVLGAVFPGAGGIIDSLSGQQTFCSGGIAGGTFCNTVQTTGADSRSSQGTTGLDVSDLPAPGDVRNDSDARVRVLPEGPGGETGEPTYIRPGETQRVEAVYPADGGPPIKVPSRNIPGGRAGASGIVRPDGIVEIHGNIIRVLGTQVQIRGVPIDRLNPRISTPADRFPPGVPYDPSAGK